METEDEETFGRKLPILTEEQKLKLVEQNKRLIPEFKANQLEKDAKKHWDLFYKRNENRFFKDRHWITREFQELLSDSSQTLWEIGCGVGNLFYPLLEEGLNFKVIACDFSPRAISLVQRHPLYAQSDIQAFSADITCPEELEQIPLNCVDVATLVFVLSAIHPKKWSQAMDNIYKRIKPGGWLLIRDYGRYDMAQIRFKSGHKIADNFYMRQDGTRSYYFLAEELEALAESSGFKTTICDYVERRTINKKEKIDVPRIFVQGKFQKTGAIS